MPTQEFKNDYLIANMEELPNCLIRFSAELKGPKVEELKKKALKTISKEVSIPGFRPGKGPEDLIEKKYSKQIRMEFEELAARQAVADAIDLSKRFPMKKEGGVSVDKLEVTDNGVKLSFHYETFPVLPKIDLTSLPIADEPKQEVKDEAIEKTLKELQLYHAKWNEVSDRPVQEDDFVVIDIDVLDEPTFKAYENSRFHVVEKGMPNWARKKIIGLKKGESVEALSERDNEPEETFSPKNCRITVNMIQTAELPELNDALAQKAGVKNVEDLKNSIRKELENNLIQMRKDKLRIKMRDQLFEKCEFELPGEDMKKLESDCLQMTERDLGADKPAEEINAHKEKLVENGKKVIRFAYMVPFLANQMGIERPSAELVNQRMYRIVMEHYMRTMEKVPEEEYPVLFQRIERDLLTEEVLDKIIEKNLKAAV
jgi:trigger factor